MNASGYCHCPAIRPLLAALLSGVVATLMICSQAQAEKASPASPDFGFGDVAERARELATQSFEPPPRALPAELSELNFDTWRAITHRPEHWLWRDAAHGIEVQLEHVGMFYTAPVRLNLVQDGEVLPVSYDAASFDMGGVEFDPDDLDTGSGIAGFSLRHGAGAAATELLARFLGASRFQALGQGQVPGAAARGLAINTGINAGEQYPWFREFWLVAPAASDAMVVVFALLDAPGLTGAYQFEIAPGDTATVKVRAQLFFRQDIEKLGIAPLVGTWLHGPMRHAREPDFRPAVHDVEGLSVHLGSGEWLWRPLDNPRRLSISAVGAEALRGFGLMQRQRAFRHFDDLEARFDLRPGVWVEPVGEWGSGHVELLEIPTPDDTNDNIIAFWVPAKAPEAGESLEMAWRMRWTRDDVAVLPEALAWVSQSRLERIAEPDEDGVNRVLRVDFARAGLSTLEESDPPELEVVVADAVEVLDARLMPHPEVDGWRAIVRLKHATEQPADVRLRLMQEGEPLSETWTYRLADAS